MTKNRDISASDVEAARSNLSKKLYGDLVKTTEERDRRSDILERAAAGTAAHTAAWDRFMRASDARGDAVKALQQNFFHVPA